MMDEQHQVTTSHETFRRGGELIGDAGERAKANRAAGPDPAPEDDPMGPAPIFELATSPLLQSNDGRLLIERHRQTRGFLVIDQADAHVALFTMQRPVADAFVAGWDAARFADEREADEAEEARGQLAGTPERMACWDCTNLLRNARAGFEAPPVMRRVVKLGPVVGAADPTQTYLLDCGHRTI